MATKRDGRIGAMMQGVARSIGTEVQDLAQLERRRRQAEKALHLGAPGAFSKLLEQNRGREQDDSTEPRESVTPESGESSDKIERSPNRFVMRGKQRIIRG